MNTMKNGMEKDILEAWSVDEAVAYISEHSGTQFDPLLVKLFEDNIDEFISISKL